MATMTTRRLWSDHWGVMCCFVRIVKKESYTAIIECIIFQEVGKLVAVIGDEVSTTIAEHCMDAI